MSKEEKNESSWVDPGFPSPPYPDDYRDREMAIKLLRMALDLLTRKDQKMSNNGQI
jgi:hypothetical protein